MTREYAEKLLVEASRENPGSWVEHSRVVGRAAGVIASKIRDLDEEFAFICGLLHDIGKKEKGCGSRHIIIGYEYLSKLGYKDVAQICLTHPFAFFREDDPIGYGSFSVEETKLIRRLLSSFKIDDYDRLIQLCDSLCTADGVVLLEKRLVDVSLRHGCDGMTINRWKSLFTIKEYFESLIGNSIYSLLPEVIQNTFNN